MHLAESVLDPASLGRRIPCSSVRTNPFSIESLEAPSRPARRAGVAQCVAQGWGQARCACAVSWESQPHRRRERGGWRGGWRNCHRRDTTTSLYQNHLRFPCIHSLIRSIIQKKKKKPVSSIAQPSFHRRHAPLGTNLLLLDLHKAMHVNDGVPLAQAALVGGRSGRPRRRRRMARQRQRRLGHLLRAGHSHAARFTGIVRVAAVQQRCHIFVR